MECKIEAVRFTEEAINDVIEWLGKTNSRLVSNWHEKHILLVDDKKGVLVVEIGDWIVRGVIGDYYMVRPGEFIKEKRIVVEKKSVPNRYRKKPDEIVAMQFTNETKDQVYGWIVAHKYAFYNDDDTPVLRLKTLTGVRTVEFGDWVIQGNGGGYYIMKPDIFAQTYDLVTDVTKCNTPEMK